MGILSTSVSITRYNVEGKLNKPIIENVSSALKKNTIADIDKNPSDMAVGWTSTENPFLPDFDKYPFIIGNHFIFSLRIDKKTIPSKILKKHLALEYAKLLSESGKEFISRSEKKMIKDKITNDLILKVPSTPNIYDLVWNYEEKKLYFFTTQKSANEELETFFSKTFKLSLIRLFPFTIADLTMDLSDKERDILYKLTPSKFKD